ncbi:MAG TPA: ABC transporter permease [Stellaceae bacterium]|jgi:NitT/TauT family transport system permease protein|nr:ABC transporter permease [Stellaceae bacterium]
MTVLVKPQAAEKRPPGVLDVIRDTYFAYERGILGVLAFVLFLLIWEGLGRGWWADLFHAESLRVKPIMLSAPSTIAAAAWHMYFVTGEMWRHLGLSGFEFLLGFLASCFIGIPAGLICGRYRDLAYAAEPLLNALNATPQVALIPLVVLWIGTGLGARVFIIALLMIVPLIINGFAAMRTVEPKYLTLAKSFGAGEWTVFRTIILPASTPFLLAGIRLSIGRGMIGIVVGEIYGAPVGIGVMINQAGQTFQTAKVFVGVLTIVICGLVLSEVVRRIERRVERWRPQIQEQSS